MLIDLKRYPLYQVQGDKAPLIDPGTISADIVELIIGTIEFHRRGTGQDPYGIFICGREVVVS